MKKVFIRRILLFAPLLLLAIILLGEHRLMGESAGFFLADENEDEGCEEVLNPTVALLRSSELMEGIANGPIQVASTGTDASGIARKYCYTQVLTCLILSSVGEIYLYT